MDLQALQPQLKLEQLTQEVAVEQTVVQEDLV
jgi:hypothetical protein